MGGRGSLRLGDSRRTDSNEQQLLWAWRSKSGRTSELPFLDPNNGRVHISVSLTTTTSDCRVTEQSPKYSRKKISSSLPSRCYHGYTGHLGHGRVRSDLMPSIPLSICSDRGYWHFFTASAVFFTVVNQ